MRPKATEEEDGPFDEEAFTDDESDGPDETESDEEED
jgi:hypothetical protein